MDHDDNKGRRRFMVNGTSKHVPVICLDDDDEDCVKSDKDYKMFLDHLEDSSGLLDCPIRYEVDNGEFDTRKFDMSSGESKRSEVKNESPMTDTGVTQQRKRGNVGFKAETSRAGSLGLTKETILRDNRAAERRKRRIEVLAREQDNTQRQTKMSKEKGESSRDVPLVIGQESIQQVREIADLMAETSIRRRAVPLFRDEEGIRRVKNVKANTSGHVRLVRAHEDIRQVNNVKVNTSVHVPLVSDQGVIRRVNNVKVNTSGDVPLVSAEEDIRRVNNVKVNTSGHVQLVRAHEDIHRVNNVKVHTSGNVRLVREHEDTQRDQNVCEGRKRRLSELEPETVRRAVPLVSVEEDINRDKKVMKFGGLDVYTESGVKLFRKQKVLNRDHEVSEGRKSALSGLEPETLRRNVPLVRAKEDTQQDRVKGKTISHVPLVRSQEHIQQYNVVAEQRKREIVETKAAGKSMFVPVVLKAVGETSKTAQVNQRNKGDVVGRKKKNEEAVVDKDYKSYLKWLVGSVKDSKTMHVANLQNGSSSTPKESTVVPGKDLLANVKVEQDLESLSDGSDIIAMSDFPFTDGESTPFVASKSVVLNLENCSEEDESRCFLFKKELTDVLKKPYNEQELLELSNAASVQKPVTRSRELRKGREKVYSTDKLGQSYLQNYSDFDKEYKLVADVDKVKALKLLRGFFFYLKNCSRPDAFKPWSKDI